MTQQHSGLNPQLQKLGKAKHHHAPISNAELGIIQGLFFMLETSL